jgi:CRP/FNR family cyclic AMP-dependent transcriptional regulator
VLGGSIKDRVRPANAAELDGIPWLPTLTPAERRRAEATLVVGEAEPGDLVCRVGRSPTYWFGVVEGLLKMSNDNADGGSVTYTGVPPGGWFGEGTVMKREPYRYNIQALRRSVVAGLPIESFHWLLDHSIGFNRFVMNQLNERLGQFIAALEIDRLNNPDARVARNLVSLFNPVLYPGVGEVLRITQQELAYLVGLSRQRVNEALNGLSAQGLIRVEYGGLRVLDLPGLRATAMSNKKNNNPVTETRKNPMSSPTRSRSCPRMRKPASSRRPRRAKAESRRQRPHARGSHRAQRALTEKIEALDAMLAKPLSEILADREKADEAALAWDRFGAMWMLSQRAMRRVALDLAAQLGVSEEEVVARAMVNANAVLNGADEVDLGGTIAPAQLQHIARHRSFLRKQFRTG